MEIKIFSEEVKTVPKYIIYVDNTEVEHFITLFARELGESLDTKSDIYKGLLKHITDAEITLDILNYINGLGDEEKVNAQKISDELGYKKEKVEEVISEIFRRRGN
ncbi:hypothetical protein KAW18_02665 [candidate division WOR-3 bacterium]|nr:hypothetical protein [candidate division WOR-3 bacterium]